MKTENIIIVALLVYLIMQQRVKAQQTVLPQGEAAEVSGYKKRAIESC